MKIAIIGAGFTGLSAAYQLTKKGHKVTIFEKDSLPGGLAIGYKEKEWNWSLEKHYHHWFTNDESILKFAKEIGQNVITKTPKTSVFIKNEAYQLDSPLALLRFNKLPLSDRIRMGIVLAALRYNPLWKPLEKIHALPLLPILMGKKGWKMIWEPQLYNKMGEFAHEISLAWFWTRINKRTTSLAYPEGGYLFFAEKIVKKIKSLGGIFHFNSKILSLTENSDKQIIIKTDQITEIFDKAIVTLPSFLFLKIATELPDDYKNKLHKLKGLAATDIVLRLKKQFLRDGTYWLSICEKDSPVLVVVEHTNLLNKKHYNNEHIVYLGNYPKITDKEYIINKTALLKFYDPLLQRINPEYKKNLISFELFKAPFAQPIIPVNYSRLIPSMKTPLKNVILANIEQVYPWDRGTNYAVELGKKAAKLVTA